MSSRWKQFRSPPRPRARPNTCDACRAPVIWARIRGPARSGRRAYLPFLVERCEPGAGNIALSVGLFADGQAPLAQEVSNATGYRSHRDHCPAQPPKTTQSVAGAAGDRAPRSFTAQSFTKKRSGGSR